MKKETSIVEGEEIVGESYNILSKVESLVGKQDQIFFRRSNALIGFTAEVQANTISVGQILQKEKVCSCWKLSISES